MITKEILQTKIDESNSKITAWVTAINQEAAKIELCEQLIKTLNNDEQVKVEQPQD